MPYLLQLLLGLPELSQVEGCDLFGVLDLSLVGPSLVLQLLGQVAQLTEPLPVLLSPELQFADLAVSA
jgi:hypothetical protein